jgi:MFS family permease
VAGLILLGVVLLGLFVWIESRAKDPILHLELFTNRTFSASVLATGLVSFGFFGGLVFIPLWFQTVQGASATASGYQILPMMAGLLVGSIGSGQIVSRTGRYKWLVASAMVVAGIGILLMTQLHASTSVQTLWIWLAIMGLGIGPSMAVFTIIVQNAVPFRQMGVATSALTFFRQIGGSIGLAIAGTVFGSSVIAEVPRQLAANGIPQPITDQITSHISQGEVTSVGDAGTRLLSQVPDQFRPLIEPLVPRILAAFNEAMSLAIANALWFGVAAAAVAAVIIVVFLPELPLRTHAAEPARSGESEGPAPIAAFD